MRVIDEGKAAAFQAVLKAVDVCRLPVLSRDRSMDRRERAAAVRQLFRQLRLRGASVTTPHYSMAHTVDIDLPRVPEAAHDHTKWPHHHDGACCGQPGGHPEELRCPACRDHAAAVLAVEEILARTFPQHDDRSDYVTDLFDFCWTVD